MDVSSALLDSWDRQARIVRSVAGLVNENNKVAKPSPDGWPLWVHLAHIHKVRSFFLAQLDPGLAESLPETFSRGWSGPIDDLELIKTALDESGIAVRQAVAQAFENGQAKVGWYDNPVLFLQHMIWHEGWHVGLIFLGLRLNGEEPAEEWEEANVWGQFRMES